MGNISQRVQSSLFKNKNTIWVENAEVESIELIYYQTELTRALSKNTWKYRVLQRAKDWAERSKNQRRNKS